jgi:hypothetical protein
VYLKIIYIVFLLFSWTLYSEDLPIDRLGEREKVTEEEYLGDPILYALEKDLAVLADLLKEDDHYNIPFKDPIIYPRWNFVGGPLLQLDVGADGTLFGITANKKVFKYIDERFKGQSGLVSQISVGDKNNICAIGANNSIFKLDSKKRWRGLKGKAKYISCGADGTIAAIYTDKQAKKYKRKVGSLVILRKGKWRNIPGQLEFISVGSKNNIWGLKTSGSVWFWDGKKWERKPGQMEYISAAADGTVAAIGENGGAYLWDGLDWVNVAGVNLVIISAQSNGKYWAITADGSLWKSLKE